MALDAALKSALQEAGFHAATAIKIETPNEVIRLFDGSGIVTIAGETYEGIDDLFGTLDAIGEINEAIAQQAPTVEVNLMIPNELGMASIAQPENQNSAVSVYFGVIEYATGTTVGTSELLWRGRLDTVKVISGVNRQTVELSTVSAFDRLFADEEAARLNSTWHQRIWANETGLDRLVAGLVDPYWGAEGGGSASGGGNRGGDPSNDPTNRQVY